MKMRLVRDLDTIAVSFRSAWDMRRAWSPICASPISPSISALGTSAARDAADAECSVHGEGPGRIDRDWHLRAVAQAHDGALAELPFDLRQRRLDRAPFLVGFHSGHLVTFRTGVCPPSELRDYRLR